MDIYVYLKKEVDHSKCLHYSMLACRLINKNKLGTIEDLCICPFSPWPWLLLCLACAWSWAWDGAESCQESAWCSGKTTTTTTRQYNCT